MERKNDDGQCLSQDAGTAGAAVAGRRGDVDGRVRHRHDRGGGLRRNSLHRGHRRLDRQCVDQHHRQGAEHERLSRVANDAGGVTVEAAFAIASLAVVLVACLAGVSAMVAQVRCIDSAREAARLAARGDEPSAVETARRIGPRGSVVHLRAEGDLVLARVTAVSPLWFRIPIEAEAVAAREPGR